MFIISYIFQCIIIYHKLGQIKSNRLPLYYFRIFHYLGGLSQLYYLDVLCINVYTFFHIILFNLKHQSRYEWMKLIEVLNTESQSIHLLGLNDKYYQDESRKYLSNIKFVYKM